MSDPRDTNHDGKVSLMEKVKGMFHHHHQGTTASGPIAGGLAPVAVAPVAVAPVAGVAPAMPAAGMMHQYGAVCQDPNCPDNINACNDPNCGHLSGASGFSGSGFRDARDLNHDGHISTSERLATGATGFGKSGFSDSRDLNHDGHISTGERLASAGLGNNAGFAGSRINNAEVHDSLDRNPNIHINEGERLATGAAGFGHTGFSDSRDLNRDGHISTGERLATGAAGFGHTGFDEAQRLRLHEEQLAVAKRDVGAGAVDIHKRVKEENVQQTVPLVHQELAIERHALHGLPEPGARISSQDEIIHVPLYREELVTEKRVVPTEEVIVRKNELMENQTVGAVLRSEYVEPVKQTFDARDVNHDGHVSMGEKFKGMSMNNNGYDARDTNLDGHVSVGEKIKGAFGTNTTKAARG